MSSMPIFDFWMSTLNVIPIFSFVVLSVVLAMLVLAGYAIQVSLAIFAFCGVLVGATTTIARLDHWYTGLIIIKYLEHVYDEGELIDTSKDFFMNGIIFNYCFSPPEEHGKIFYGPNRDQFNNSVLICTKKSKKYFECYNIVHKISIQIPFDKKYWDNRIFVPDRKKIKRNKNEKRK